MLNGIAPIFLFNFSKLVKGTEGVISQIPILSDVRDSLIGFPPIPLYLSESLTGIYIDSEAKNVDAETSNETIRDASGIITNQKAVNSTITINMKANRNSLGITIMSAMMDLIYGKLTSKEYSITYLHGAVTIFGGLLHSFAINQNSDNDLYEITVTLIKNTNNTLPKSPIPVVLNVPGVIPGVSQ